MEERSRDVIGLLEELTEQNRQQTASLKKQLFVTRILAAAGCVLAAAVIAVFLLIVPPVSYTHLSFGAKRLRNGGFYGKTRPLILPFRRWYPANLRPSSRLFRE